MVCSAWSGVARTKRALLQERVVLLIDFGGPAACPCEQPGPEPYVTSLESLSDL